MLSILIPVYNTKCIHLVEALHAQASQLGIPYEIVVADDASRPEFIEANRQICRWSECRYLLLETNIGPARIRNYLAREAKYRYLLFLDSDTYPASDHFLNEYVRQLTPGTVICGGFIYQRNTPEPGYALRYYYGIHVEEKSAEERNQHPYTRFIGMNFLADRNLFTQISFDETMHFGYEDAWWGIRLKQEAIPLIHIENPVYHLSTDTSAAYLEKIRRSVNNLSQHIDKMRPYIRLLQWYTQLEKYHLPAVVSFIFRKSRRIVEKNLTGPHPSLRLFAFYKLGYLCLLRQKSQ